MPVQEAEHVQVDKTEGQAVHTNTVATVQNRPAAAVMNQSAENEALWHAVFEEGEDGAGSFNLIRNGTVLTEVGEKAFVVIAKNDFTKKYAVQKQEQLESIMSRRLGRQLRMLCYSREETIPAGIKSAVGEEETEKKDSLEDMARKASEILGMDIEIE